jgi:hypothetical protein
VVTAVPESFDSMLAELADAAASSVLTPDLADVRRRARQRTVRRRLTASALAFALVCVSGVAAAAIDGRSRPAERVTPLSAPSASPSPLATSGVTGTAMPTPSSTGLVDSTGTDYAAYAGVWSTGSLLASYAIVFPDGVVGVAQKTGFPLCYGQVVTTASASPATGVTLSRATPVSRVPFTQGDCDGSIGAGDLIFADTGGSPSLTVTDSAKTTEGSPLVFTRVASISAAATAAAGSAAVIKQLTGDWMELDDKSQMLSVNAAGEVTYGEVGATDSDSDSDSGFFGTGQLDGYYGLSARAVTDCSAAVESQVAKEGLVGDASKFCGVLLLHVGPAASEMTVYTGVGLQVFVRVD